MRNWVSSAGYRRSFVNAIYADPKVLAFVAFNVFADGVSLLETR